MRKFAVLLFAFISFASANAFAVTAEEWKADLNNQMILLKAAMPGMVMDGQITTSQQGQSLQAVVPPISASDQRGRKWTLPVLKLQADPAQPVVQTLKIMPQAEIDVTETTSINPVNTKVSFDSADLVADQGKSMRLNIHNLKTALKSSQFDRVITARNANIKYDASFDKNMPLFLVFLMWQQELGSQPLLASGNFDGVTLTQNGKTTTLETLAAQAQLNPDKDGKNLTFRNAIQANGLLLPAAGMFSSFAPSKADLIGSITNLPIEAFARGMNFQDPELQKLMSAAGTKITIDSLKTVSPKGSTITGTGWLQPAQNKIGFIGRLVLEIAGLQDMMLAAQKNMSNIDKDTSLVNQSKAMAGIMLVQGVSQQSDVNVNQMTLHLTADGRALLNGKDLSGMVTMLQAGNSTDNPESRQLSRVPPMAIP